MAAQKVGKVSPVAVKAVAFTFKYWEDVVALQPLRGQLVSPPERKKMTKMAAGGTRTCPGFTKKIKMRRHI